MRALHAAALLLILAACGRTYGTKPAPTAPQADQDPSVGTWTWHPIGGLAVVEGEVSQPTDLVLEGRSIRERRYAEIGPVRWEFFRPPDGESAVLRTAEGRELARFTFAQAPKAKPAPPPPRQARRHEPVPPPPALAPAPSPSPAPAPPRPPVPAPAPKTRAEVDECQIN